MAGCLQLAPKLKCAHHKWANFTFGEKEGIIDGQVKCEKIRKDGSVEANGKSA